MADGNNIHLDDERAAKLKALADMADMSPEEYTAMLIDRDLDQASLHAVDPDPAIDRAIIDHAIATGEFKPWAEVRDRLLARHRR